MVAGWSTRPRVREGLCTVFIRHTSASLVIQENADPAVQRDLEAFFSRLVPDGDRLFTHVTEGPDDMPSHVKAALTRTSEQIPIVDGRLGLGPGRDSTSGSTGRRRTAAPSSSTSPANSVADDLKHKFFGRVDSFHQLAKGLATALTDSLQERAPALCVPVAAAIRAKAIARDQDVSPRSS